MVANEDKCHLLTSTSEEMSVKIKNEIIKIVIHNRLTFELHVENLCKKAGQKLHAPAGIANYGCFTGENVTIEQIK